VKAQTAVAERARVHPGELVGALSQLGFHATAGAVTPTEPWSASFELFLDWDAGKAKRMLIQSRGRAAVTASDAVALVSQMPTRKEAVPMVMADRISEEAKRTLRQHRWGWLDRRGHIRLVARSVCIDAPVQSTTPVERTGEPLQGGVALEVAASHLISPQESLGVRSLERKLGRAASAISNAQRRMREAGLLQEDYRPQNPELFWELAARWKPHWVHLAGIPDLREAADLRPLTLGVDQTLGWAIVGTRAAIAYGAPVVAGADYPPEFVVPSERALRAAVDLFGVAPTPEQSRCAVAVSPIRLATTTRAQLEPRAAGDLAGWPFTHPLFVALELARDAGRGREILSGWEPDPAVCLRVW